MKPTVPVRKRSLQRGMSAVELAIVLGIGATLAATAGPDFSGFFANVQLRAASNNLRSGLRLAQLEAVKRQSPVELVLTGDAPTAATVRPSVDGRNWVIRAPLPDGRFELIETSTLARQTSRVRVEAERGVFAFDPFGRLRADSFGHAAPTREIHIELSDHESRGRPLRVVVRPAGATTSCDPNAAGNDPFACG
jgi:Tfp pilus assembly protein FimT